MKNYKQFIAGVVVGGVLLTSGNALANNAVIPTITNWVKYTFDGVEKTLPSSYTTLNYEGHTYVPARFIAEELGAEVEWDDATKTVEIIKEQQQVEEPPQQQETEDTKEPEQQPVKDEEDEDTKYEELPVSKMVDGVRVEVYSVEHRDNYTKFYIDVKNTTEKPFRLNQESVYFKVGNNNYKHTDASKNMYWKDTTWFNELEEDDDAQGYVMLSKIDKDDMKGQLYIEVEENAVTPKVLSYSFDINLEGTFED